MAFLMINNNLIRLMFNPLVLPDQRIKIRLYLEKAIKLMPSFALINHPLMTRRSIKEVSIPAMTTNRTLPLLLLKAR